MNLFCDVCERTGFSSKASLNSHKCKFHPNTELLAKRTINNKRSVICPFCGVIFPDREIETLRIHLRNCFYDEEDFDLPPLTAQDLQDYQKPGDNYVCTVCPQALKTAEDLQAHLYENHPACLKCEAGFNLSYQYDRHVKNCRAEFNPNKLQKRNESQCPVCKEVLVNRYQLKRHLEDTHSMRKRKVRKGENRS